MLIVGIVIGAGIFKSPALVAGFAGGTGWMFAAWLVGGLVSLAGALCYAELATAYSHAGGEYHFLRRAYGTSTAFLFGWARLSVITTGSIALLAFVFGDYMHQLAPLEFAGRRDAFPRAEAALREVGLGHRLDHYPGQLSGGEQQRAALARAVVAEPPLLLADEPTGNLDRGTGAQVMDLIFGLRERLGTTLLLITHDPALAERCGRVVRMEDGLIAENREPSGERAR